MSGQISGVRRRGECDVRVDVAAVRSAADRGPGPARLDIRLLPGRGGAGRLPDIVLVDPGDSTVRQFDAAEPTNVFADPRIEFADALLPGVDRHRRVDPANAGLISRAVDGVLQLEIRGQGVCPELGRPG